MVVPSLAKLTVMLDRRAYKRFTDKLTVPKKNDVMLHNIIL